MWRKNKTNKQTNKQKNPKLGQHSPSSEAITNEDWLYVHQ